MFVQEAGAEDKLFATLDTRIRAVWLSEGTNVLLVDTIGFIQGLPHDLVAAFRSTLEEALCADVLVSSRSKLRFCRCWIMLLFTCVS